METSQTRNTPHPASILPAPSFRPSSLWLCHGSQLCTSPVSAGLLTCSWSGFLCNKDSSTERRDRCVYRRHPSDVFVRSLHASRRYRVSVVWDEAPTAHSGLSSTLGSWARACIQCRAIDPLVLVHTWLPLPWCCFWAAKTPRCLQQQLRPKNVACPTLMAGGVPAGDHHLCSYSTTAVQIVQQTTSMTTYTQSQYPSTHYRLSP